MIKLTKIDKYVSKFADKVDYSSTTNSRYYYVCNHCLRISDHGSFKPGCDWSIIFDQRNPNNFILMGGKTTSLTVLKYEEIRSIISTEPKSADDLVDVSKLTIGKASQAIEMNEFTRGQRTTILSFLRQNKGKRFK